MASEGEPPKKRQRTEGVVVPEGLTAFHHIEDWYEENKASFSPPICNKLMHKGQLSIMFVGGPNTRKDFHLEEGSEFFYQMKGDIELPTVQRGKRKLVKIREGQVFCLPSRVPHSPQRPNTGSLGLVIERERVEGEMDGLIYFTDFEKCEKVHWERFFHCADLGKDLPPVVKAYKEFEATDAGKRWEEWPPTERPVSQDLETEVPAPFNLSDFLLAHEAALGKGSIVPLFGGSHPDKEFRVQVAGGPSKQTAQRWSGETWLHQVRGTATVSTAGGSLTLQEGCCCIVCPGTAYDVSREAGSVGLIVRQDPRGNKPRAVGEAGAEGNVEDGDCVEEGDEGEFEDEESEELDDEEGEEEEDLEEDEEEGDGAES